MISKEKMFLSWTLLLSIMYVINVMLHVVIPFLRHDVSHWTGRVYQHCMMINCNITALISLLDLVHPVYSNSKSQSVRITNSIVYLGACILTEIRLSYKTLFYAQLIIKFVMLINVKMPTIVCILTIITMINTTSKSVKARKNFYFTAF